ncbi:MAG: prolipoprotein diacylglyceryl transferase [Rickettsiales bacterium]|nr:prolipoprotein diacylglyceryl transferase [Rickettsiales bacterium]
MFSLLALTYPQIDPVAVQLGPIAIRWYSLAYLAGVVLGAWMLKRINRARTPALISDKHSDDLMAWAIGGILLGGRLGYVLFYKPAYFLANPGEILAIWEGGMSFHGGLLGLILAFYIFARRQKISYLELMDQIACIAPIGLFFGRLANFINGELFGRIAPDVPWAMVFPDGGPLPRHPSQLYEAALEGLLLFAVLNLLRLHTGIRYQLGMLSGLFLIGYGLSRAFVELFREPDAHLGFIIPGITMGQILCLPMIAIGLFLVWHATRKRPTSAA